MVRSSILPIVQEKVVVGRIFYSSPPTYRKPKSPQKWDIFRGSGSGRFMNFILSWGWSDGLVDSVAVWIPGSRCCTDSVTTFFLGHTCIRRKFPKDTPWEMLSGWLSSFYIPLTLIRVPAYPWHWSGYLHTPNPGPGTYGVPVYPWHRSGVERK